MDPSALTMADFADCIETGPTLGEVGFTGDIEELREYPCNCFNCRGRPNAVAPEHGDCYHDGELSWWECCFCHRFFDLEDMECMSGDTQGCEACTGAWYAKLAEHRAATVPEPPRCTGDECPMLDGPGTPSVA